MCHGLVPSLCLWLKEEKHQRERHPLMKTGSPCLCARGSPATHRGWPCRVVLMERSLLSWPERVTVLLTVDYAGSGLGRSYLSWRAWRIVCVRAGKERAGAGHGLVGSACCRALRAI